MWIPHVADDSPRLGWVGDRCRGDAGEDQQKQEKKARNLPAGRGTGETHGTLRVQGIALDRRGWRRCSLEMQQQKRLAQQELNPPINLLALPERNV
jgi:hypothetical protein